MNPAWFRKVASELEAGPTRAANLAVLTDYLYTHHFCCWKPSRLPSRGTGDPPSGDPSLVALLRGSVEGATYWDEGWELTAGPSPAFVANGQIQLFIEDKDGLSPRNPSRQAKVRVRLPCVRENLLDGYVYFIARGGRPDRGAPQIRFYLALGHRAAPALLTALFRDRALADVRFEAKLPNDPRFYGRLDAGVLYTEPAGLSQLSSWLARWRRSQTAGWGRTAPLFSFPLCPGIGVAESPAASEGEAVTSFGEHRCALVAKGILEGIGAGDRRGASWRERVQSVFDREGISFEAPYFKTVNWVRRGAGLRLSVRGEGS